MDMRTRVKVWENENAVEIRTIRRHLSQYTNLALKPDAF